MTMKKIIVLSLFFSQLSFYIFSQNVVEIGASGTSVNIYKDGIFYQTEEFPKEVTLSESENSYVIYLSLGNPNNYTYIINKHGEFSLKPFWNVIAFSSEQNLVAETDIDSVIVWNYTDTENPIKIIELHTSPVAVVYSAIRSANFLTNGIEITYLIGDEYLETTELFQLH
jgi:hypothetical protein